MDISSANAALFLALSQAQGEIENASKTSENPHFRSKYADLAEILNTVRPVFSKHGLTLVQSTEFDGAMVSVVTLLAHKDGGYLTSRASCVPAKSDAQGVGSATTYLRRYSAAAAAGIAQEDDDGQSASHNRKPNPVSATGKTKPTDGVFESFDPESQQALRAAAAHVMSLGIDRVGDAVEFLDKQYPGTDERTAIWDLMASESKLRAAIKVEMNKRKGNQNG